MTLQRCQGLTWNHPRGFRPLRETIDTARRFGLDMEWDIQPLEGFESHPIEDLAARYDLLIVDHPHCGDIAKAGCIRSLEEAFGADEALRWSQAAIGSSGSSYRYAGAHWAAPLDAATQVSVVRPDLVDTAPDDWHGALALAETVPTMLPLGGPHPILTLISIAIAHGEEPGRDALLSREIGTEAWMILSHLVRSCVNAGATLNPIRVLDAMSREKPAASYCPLIYGYVTYSRAAEHPHTLRFADAPLGKPGGRRGSTLGGTGLAISRRANLSEPLLKYCRWLMEDRTQRDVIPALGGQPGLRSAWIDPVVNGTCDDFYLRTRQTIESAWVRPRFSGFIDFQADASSLLRHALETDASPSKVVADLNQMYETFRKKDEEA
jgi:multiple sugar transport system substrate-binding protein